MEGIDAYSSGSGSSGSIDVTAGNVVISGVKDIFAANISADVGESGSGKGGAIRIATNNLEVKDGGEISATSYGQGDAGSIIITAKDILLDGGSHFTAYISANARGSGNAGDINIGTNTLEMRGGAQIQAVTTAEGQGGSVRINAADQVILSGIQEASQEGIKEVTTTQGYYPRPMAAEAQEIYKSQQGIFRLTMNPISLRGQAGQGTRVIFH